MIRLLRICLPILCTVALLCACAAPPDSAPAVVGAARLICFSDQLPASGGNCDALCAAGGAACVGIGTGKGAFTLPLPACDDTLPPSSSMSCRCCSVAR